MDPRRCYEKWKVLVEPMNDRRGAEITAYAIEQEATRLRDRREKSANEEMKLAAAVVRRVCMALLQDSAVDQLARVGRDLPKRRFTTEEIYNRVSVETLLVVEAGFAAFPVAQTMNSWARDLSERLAGYLAEVAE